MSPVEESRIEGILSFVGVVQVKMTPSRHSVVDVQYDPPGEWVGFDDLSADELLES
jgi:hypothetical protein